MQLSKSHLKPYVLPKLSNDIWAYIAGIMDGESHIRKFISNIPKSGGVNYGLEIAIAQNEKGIDLLYQLKDWLQDGSIMYKNPPKGTNIPVYQYSIRKRLAIYAILKKVRPYLIVKLKRANELITFMERTYQQRAKQP